MVYRSALFASLLALVGCSQHRPEVKPFVYCDYIDIDNTFTVDVKFPDGSKKIYYDKFFDPDNPSLDIMTVKTADGTEMEVYLVDDPEQAEMLRLPVFYRGDTTAVRLQKEMEERMGSCIFSEPPEPPEQQSA